MIDFPQNPTPGQTFTAAGVSWTFDGVKWTPTGSTGGAFVLKTGDTMTGNLGAPALSGSTPGTVPVAAANPMTGDNSLNLATTAWTNQAVNGARWGDNRIVNGDMRIDQRNNGASGTGTSVYTIDRWFFASSTAGRGTWQRAPAQTSLLALGFGYSLQFTSASAYTPLATETYAWRQPIEADMVADFAWGTINAQPVTLSFWVQSTLIGTFSGAIGNAVPGTRAYPFSYSIPAANTWTRISITIPGDTAGTWTFQSNGIGAVVWFDLGNGANLRAPAGAWTSGDIRGANGTVSTVSTNAAGFWITGVKLEIGSVATPFNRQSLAKSLADCQRYYQVIGNVVIGGYQPSAGSLWSPLTYNTTMRAGPTAALLGAPSYTNASALIYAALGTTACYVSVTVTAAGNATVNFASTFTAEL